MFDQLAMDLILEGVQNCMTKNFWPHFAFATSQGEHEKLAVTTSMSTRSRSLRDVCVGMYLSPGRST